MSFVRRIWRLLQRRRSPQFPPIPEDWGGTVSITPISLRRMAEVMRRLFMEPEKWVHRRVERIYLKSHQMAHHQISVDFTLPPAMPHVGRFGERRVYIAPLFLLVKDSLSPMREGKRPRRRFFLFGERRPDASKPIIPTAPYSNIDFRDQAGQRIPVLTRLQSAQLTATMLLKEAERVVGSDLVTDRLRDEIYPIPFRRLADLGEVLKWLFDEEVLSSDPRAALRKDDLFTELVHILASHSIIICLLTEDEPRRPIYKLSYDEPLNEHYVSKKRNLRESFGRYVERVFQTLGWKSERYFVPLTEIGAGFSYHVEIAIPDELQVNAVTLTGKEYRRFTDLISSSDRDYFIQQIGSANEGKIYIPRPYPGRRVGLVWVKLRARRTGFLVGAVITSVFITALLILATWKAPSVLSDKTADPAAAAFLIAPALVGFFLARPGEHAITGKMLRWARLALAMNAGISTLAVFFLITAPKTEPAGNESVLTLVVWTVEKLPAALSGPGGHLRLQWGILAFFSLILSLLFVVSLIIPMVHGETIYQPMPDDSIGGEGLP